MAERSGFFDSYIVGDSYDRPYFASDFAEFFARFIGNGVFYNPSTSCQIIANDNMTVTVKVGYGYINGFIYINDSDFTLNISPADGVANRIDRIVLQYDIAGRIIKAVVKEGSFAANPTAPTIQRDADYYELGLADISIIAGATSITQSSITDLRLNSNYCGVVSNLLGDVDTTTIFNQYQAWLIETQEGVSSQLQSTIAQLESAFDTFFNDIKGTLAGDVAGNLYNRIVAAEGRITQNESDITSLDNRLDLQERVLTAIIPATGWSSVAPYSVEISVPGLTDSRPKINPIYSETNEVAILEDEEWGKISKIKCLSNVMTVYCFSETPARAINVEIVGA